MTSSNRIIANRLNRRFWSCVTILPLAVGAALAADGADLSQKTQIAQFPFNIFGGDNSHSPSQPASVVINASSDINPGPSGGGAPLSVQIFMLRSPGRFQTLDYFQLRDGAANTLGADLVDRQTISVLPGGSVNASLNTAVMGQVGYIGVIAGFRQIDNAQWRAVAAVPYGSSAKVFLSRLSVSVSAVAPTAGRQ